MDESQIPPQHRSIQDIIPPARSRPIRPMTPNVPPPPPPTPPKPLDLNPNRPRGTGMAILVVVGIVIVIAAVLGIVTTLFHRAYVTVTPQTYAAVVNSNFETSPSHPLLPYQTVTADDTASQTVAASGSQNVQNHASGIITVYNAYSKTSQRLITNTRFQNKDGVIFRTHTPITIPGYTMKAGVKVPGQTDVTVYADQAGDQFNVAPGDFNIPGLKGSPQFDLMYGRSTVPMNGGFIGEQAVVDPKVRSDAVTAIKADLQRSLQSKIMAAVPEGYVVFPDTVQIVYSEKTDTLQGKNAVVAVSATAMAPAFVSQTIAKAIADAASVQAQGPVVLQNPNELSAHLNSPDALGSDTPVTLSVSGNATLVSVIDTTQLAKDLAGKSKGDVTKVLPAYPGISDIVVKVYPFWLSTIPGNLKNIIITTPKG